MSLFKQIENLGIPIKELAELTEQDIIRIEKKLKAQVRLDNTLDTNDVVKIVHALRKEKVNIATLFQGGFKGLLDILQSENEFVYKVNSRFTQLKFEPDFIRFLASNFEDELKNYVERCIRVDHYYGLHSLLYYTPVISSELLQLISRRLEQKLDFMIESMRIGSEQIEIKTQAAANPFFYRCLNRLGGIQFESDISTLLNTTLEHIKTKKWNFRILFAQGAFRAISDNLKEALAQNKTIAFNAGTREKTYPAGKPKGKGGTTISRFNSGRKRRPENKASGGSYHYFIWPIIVAGMLLLRMITADHNDRKIEFPSNFQETITLEDVLHLGTTKGGFVDLMKYLHSDTVEIIAQRDIAFNLKNTNLAPGQTSVISASSLYIKNDTERSIVVIAERHGLANSLYYCLNPNQQIAVLPQLSSIRIYSGNEPQIIDYMDDKGDILSHFRFNEFTQLDLWNLEAKHSVNAVFNTGGKQLITITLSQSAYRVKVGLLD
ncbi:MAG: hypothetical protein GQ574_19390 [Crocinitomix sp.]|nr:hypothetical protein [Crocinitomix sp.]